MVGGQGDLESLQRVKTDPYFTRHDPAWTDGASAGPPQGPDASPADTGELAYFIASIFAWISQHISDELWR